MRGSARRVRAVVAVVSLLSIGCRAPQANAGGSDASTGGGPDGAGEARGAVAGDAAPPPDELLPANADGDLTVRARHLL
ncbi:MAG TPA: hypothetical protein VEK07_15785, partial [Polyangiaceae bacterium]|nr:hypothetical protein [Polyangiaceae bacterium]